MRRYIKNALEWLKVACTDGFRHCFFVRHVLGLSRPLIRISMLL